MMFHPARRGLAAVVATFAGLLVLLWTAGPAAADSIDTAISTLRNSAVYVEGGATRDGDPIVIDTDKVSAALGSDVKVAVFKPGADINSAGTRIGATLGRGATLAVLSGTQFESGSTKYCTGAAGTAFRTAAKAHQSDVDAGNYTDTLVAWGQALDDLATCTSGTAAGGGTSGSSSQDSGSSAWPWLVGLGGLAAVGGGGYVWSRKRKATRDLAAAKSAVMPYYDRLANEVNTVNTEDNKVARQAMADASERFTAAGSQMDTATTVENWAGVRRTALEGLQAAQLARKELGLPPGPELPPIDQPRGEQLTSAQTVDVQGKQYQGYPQYAPGAPYYFGGGGGYAGGWYSFPFWETMLIGSMLGGGFGGWGFGGGGYGAGYDSGYDAGRDSAQGDGGSGGWGGGFGGGGDIGGGFGGGFGGGGGGGSDGGSF